MVFCCFLWEPVFGDFFVISHICCFLRFRWVGFGVGFGVSGWHIFISNLVMTNTILVERTLEVTENNWHQTGASNLDDVEGSGKPEVVEKRGHISPGFGRPRPE